MPAPRALELAPSWRHDHPGSILTAGLRLLRRAREFDGVLFNTYITAYGRAPSANATGLVLPGLIGALAGRPTAVYMHNMVETQDFTRLGYAPSRGTRWVAHTLTGWVLRRTRVIVPLVSQARAVEMAFDLRPESLFVPCLESYLLSDGSLARSPRTGPQSPPGRVLLLGTWGPQKDLEGVFLALEELAQAGIDFELTLAGGDNRHFPGYLDRIDWSRFSNLGHRVRRLGELSDPGLFGELMTHDLLVLPYRTTGGYSGALNFAAASGIPILAYRTPQLEEQDGLLGTGATFVEPAQLTAALGSALAKGPAQAPPRAERLRHCRELTEAAIDRLAKMVTLPSPRGTG